MSKYSTGTGYFLPESRFVRFRHRLQRRNGRELSTDFGQLNGNSKGSGTVSLKIHLFLPPDLPIDYLDFLMLIVLRLIEVG
jgi:hypothetical protein